MEEGFRHWHGLERANAPLSPIGTWSHNWHGSGGLDFSSSGMQATSPDRGRAFTPSKRRFFPVPTRSYGIAIFLCLAFTSKQVKPFWKISIPEDTRQSAMLPERFESPVWKAPSFMLKITWPYNSSPLLQESLFLNGVIVWKPPRVLSSFHPNVWKQPPPLLVKHWGGGGCFQTLGWKEDKTQTLGVSRLLPLFESLPYQDQVKPFIVTLLYLRYPSLSSTFI